MSDRIPCEFFIIRYVPDLVRGEFVNIGIILRRIREDGKTKATDVIVRFTRDWSRVQRLQPEADIQLLEAFEGVLANRLAEDTAAPVITDLKDFVADGVEGYLEQHAVTRVLADFRDDLANSIQMTERHVSLAETTTKEIERLMRAYVV